ncbi:hypothetical protein SAMN05720759_1073 [Fibrobacter sp. UWB12]|nr:hypothetical protein SAMN05720759_1073 [Fibrobacter sp. UWB12]
MGKALNLRQFKWNFSPKIDYLFFFQEQMVTSAMRNTHSGYENYAFCGRAEFIYIISNRFKEIFYEKGGSHEKNHLDSFITSSRSLYGSRKENPRRILFPCR